MFRESYNDYFISTCTQRSEPPHIHHQLTVALVHTDDRCRVRIAAGVAICAPEAIGWIGGSGVGVAIEPATQIVLGSPHPTWSPLRTGSGVPV